MAFSSSSTTLAVIHKIGRYLFLYYKIPFVDAFNSYYSPKIMPLVGSWIILSLWSYYIYINECARENIAESEELIFKSILIIWLLCYTMLLEFLQQVKILHLSLLYNWVKNLKNSVKKWRDISYIKDPIIKHDGYQCDIFLSFLFIISPIGK